MDPLPKDAQVIWVRPDAPPKPAQGEPCNGCGVCCLSEPCPVGVVLSRRFTGPCAALRWVPQQRIYRCGALVPVDGALGWRRALKRWRNAWLKRAIFAGQACDCSLQPESHP